MSGRVVMVPTYHAVCGRCERRFDAQHAESALDAEAMAKEKGWAGSKHDGLVCPECRKPHRSGSGFTGVGPVTGKSKDNPWRAWMCRGGKTIHLGNFPTIGAAVQARRKAVAEYDARKGENR